jgi:5-methylthioadenosine/S-adenosylhomocysteine deaminase
MDEIFSKNYPLLISNVRVDGRANDIFVNDRGVIAAIGTGIRKKYARESEFIIDGDGAIALPGLVNTHTHAAMSLLRGYADDMFLQDWLSQKIWPLEAHLTGDDVYWGTKLACLEMIKTGTTAFKDMYFFMMDACRAVEEMGIRAVLAHGFIDLFDAEKREREIKATDEFCTQVRPHTVRRIQSAYTFTFPRQNRKYPTVSRSMVCALLRSLTPAGFSHHGRLPRTAAGSIRLNAVCLQNAVCMRPITRQAT